MVCYNCGQQGHTRRQCSQPKKNHGGDHDCRQCGEDGHFAFQCTKAGGGRDKRTCHKCGQVGHIKKNCQTRAESSRQRLECEVCGVGDHDTLDCFFGEKGAIRCDKCEKFGHTADECANQRVQHDPPPPRKAPEINVASLPLVTKGKKGRPSYHTFIPPDDEEEEPQGEWK